MSTIRYDLVALPDQELANKCIEASHKLEQFDSLFTLKIGEYYPHLSLYIFPLEHDKLAGAKELLEQIAADTPSFTARAKEYWMGQGYAEGYIDPEYHVTDEMRKLQQKVLDVFNPFRSGTYEGEIAKMQDATGAKLENLRTYGYPSIGQLFRPHVTLTRLKSYQPQATEILPHISHFDGSFDKIGLFEMGDNGTCINLVYECDLVKR